MAETMLISLPDGYHLHGWLNTHLAERVLAPCDPASPDVRLLIPPGAEDCIPPELRERGQWECFPQYRLTPWGQFASYLRMEGSKHLRRSVSWDMMRRKYNRSWKHKVARPAAWLIGAVPAMERALLAFERLVAPSPLADGRDWGGFRTVVLGSCGIKDLDVALLQVVRRTPARTYGVIYSWDNITSKMNSLVRMDRVAVWNDLMKQQAVELLGYREDQVAVTGAPQFDFYADYQPRQAREQFLTSLSLPADARYVLYSGVPRRISPWGAQYVRAILDRVTDRYVVVRTHPQDRGDAYAAVREHPRVRIFHAGLDPQGQHRETGFWTPRPEEGHTLAEQIHFADAVANVASTVTVEALLLGRPVVNIGYDAPGEKFPVPMAQAYRTEHYRVVTESGAVPIAVSAEDLGRLLRGVESWWPGTTRLRQRLNRAIDPFQDGLSARRLADDIRAFHRSCVAAGGER